MTVINSLGVNALSIRGTGTTFHRLTRIYESLAEANSDVSGGGFTPVGGVTNLALIKGVGLAHYDTSTSQFVHTATELEANVDSLISAVGISEDAVNLGTFSGSTIADNQTVKQALQALETQLEAIDLDTDDMAALTGLAENVTNLGTFSGSTIPDSQTVKQALQALETKTELNTAIVLETDGNVDDLIALTGISENTTDLGAFTGSTIADSQTIKAALQALETSLELKSTITALNAVQADVDQNESDADAAIALRATIDDPTFTTKISSPAFHASGSGHLVLKAMTGNDLNVFLAGAETLQVTRSGTDCRFTSNGGSGTFKFNQETDLAGGMKLAGVAITADGNELNLLDGVTATTTELNYVDGVTSNIQTQLDAIQSDVDTNESDADAAIALKANIASPAFTGTPTAPNAAASTNNNQIATTSYVTNAIAALTDSAPGALDTLAELATALGDDANFSTTVTNLINANETHIDNMATLTGAAKDALNLGTFTGSTIADNQTIKAALQALETADELKAPLASPAFTGQHITHTAGDTQPTTHKIIGGFPDLILQTNQGNFALHQNEGRILWNDAGAGTHGAIKMKQAAGQTMGFYVGGVTSGDLVMTIASDSVDVESLKIGGTAVTSTATELNLLDGVTATTAELNYVDGVTSNIQTQLDAIQSDVDTNESDADTALATKLALAGGTLTGNLNIAKSFPDLTLKAGDERRILFSDAGGNAEGGFKFASNTLKIFAGGGIAGGNEAIALNGTTIETKDDLVQNPGSSVTPAENGELVVEATNNTTLTFKLKGSDGTVRSGTITLS